MDYKCKTIPLAQLIAGPNGFIFPLCEKCKTIDCTNPIEKKKVSIVGVKKYVRIYMRSSVAYFVVECQGFTM